jgi:hypothetical protein
MDRNNETIRLAKKAAAAWRSTDTYHQAAQIIDMLISALSALQIENQALRNAASGFKAENEKLRDEVERQRRSADNRQHLYENAERAYMKVLAELEQAKRENETLKHALQNWHEED